MRTEVSADLAARLLGRAPADAPDGAGAAFAGRSVLVSGAGGSIGSELCRQLAASRVSRIVLLELSELALCQVMRELEPLAAETGAVLLPVLGSVCDGALLQRVLHRDRLHAVIHAAAYKHVPLVEMNPLAGLANNVLGTLSLARAAEAAGVERFVQISSDKAVRPANVMGASKRLAELAVLDLAGRSRGTVFSVVRFGNVLGSSGSVLPLFQEQLARGGPVTVTDRRVQRYFMTIGEAVQLVLAAGAAARGGEVLVLDMGRPVPILQLARRVIESAGLTVRDARNPAGGIEIRITGLRPGEKLVEELTFGKTLQPTAHPKIFSVQEPPVSETGVAAALRSLRRALAAGDDEAARALAARWVQGSGAEARAAGG